MDNLTLFYAWQSDLDSKCNRYLIRDAAKQALKELSDDSVLEEALRLDSDTLNVAGSPDVPATIFSKIDQAGIFLADLSFVGKSADDPLPNSNVLLELGYAAARIGWSRTILVMNTAYGPPEKLMFDLRHRRWPIPYRLENAEKRQIADAKLALTSALKSAILIASQEEHSSVILTIQKLDAKCLELMHATREHDWFLAPSKTTENEVLSSLAIDHAITRLLELNIIKCDVNPTKGQYAYHWTYFGKLVLYQLKMRSRSVKKDDSEHTG